jgi:NAD(P)-dependent dehydrogenase (short-subunit alcohol dehydrogenase family)
MRLDGKVALISGGARGMGAAEAKLFAKEGAKVVIGDVLEDLGKGLEAEINETGGEVLFVKLDVRKEEEWQRVVDATVRRFGKLDILVNNAGIIDRASLEETTVKIWDRIMEVNARGMFLGTKTAVPAMRKAGGGSIVNISSISGMVSVGYPAYNASKGAVRIFTKNVAVEYAKENIRVNSIHPGAIWTPMSTYDTKRSREDRAKTIPMDRVGDPIEVAYGVLFLASDEASYVTGSELVIDGGLTAE